MPYKNHLSIDEKFPKHKGKQLATTLGSEVVDQYLDNLDDLYEYKIAKIIPEVEHRPDLISEVYYNTPNFDWLILLVNGIDDPFEGLNSGDIIKIPVL